MFKKSNNPCADPECFYCGIHCPYCGSLDLVFDSHEGSMGCPACGKGTALPAPEFVEMRHQQVRKLTGRGIAEWKARARQLAAPMRWRWRTALCYLDPVSSVALSRCDDLMINGMTYVHAIAQVQADLHALQRYAAEHPELGTKGLLESGPFLDDWL
jgi:ribosomal protein S27E